VPRRPILPRVGGPEASGAGRGPRLSAIAALLAASVALSRVLGYAREAVISRVLGVSAEVDAYRAAFMLPDLLNYFLAGGALSIAFIPFYTRVRETRGGEAAQRLLAVVLGTTAVLVVIATALLWAFAEGLVALQFPRFDPAQQALTTRLTRILLPAQIFFVTGGVLRGALMAHGRFASQALAPLLYNGGIIAGGLALGSRMGAEGFAWGALAGAVAGPFLAAWIEARRTPELQLGLRVAPADPDLRRYLATALPLMLGVTLLTVDEWYDKWFGGLLAAGSIASLGYARVLMQLPVAVVGQALATAALPTLSQLVSAGRTAELDATLQNVLRAGLGLACLGAAGAYAFAGPLVALLYEGGAFTAADTARVATLLRVFAFAVPAWIVQQIAVRAFYARGDTWRPMLLGSAVAVGAAALYLALGTRFAAPGLAAAGAIGMTANALATLLLARHLHGAPDLRALAATGARALAIAVVAAAVGDAVVPLVARVPGLPAAGPLAALARLAAGGAAFAAVAFAGVRAVGDASQREALAGLARRLRRVARRLGS